MNKVTRTAKRVAGTTEDKLLDGLRKTDTQFHRVLDRLGKRRIARITAQIDELERDRYDRQPVNYSLTDLGLGALTEQFEEACKPFVVDAQGVVTR